MRSSFFVIHHGCANRNIFALHLHFLQRTLHNHLNMDANHIYSPGFASIRILPVSSTESFSNPTFSYCASTSTSQNASLFNTIRSASPSSTLFRFSGSIACASSSSYTRETALSQAASLPFCLLLFFHFQKL